MVRLADLDDVVAELLRELQLPQFERVPWVVAPPLPEARVAIVSTAGIHRREDRAFAGGATDYRILPGDVMPDDVVMTHASVNFDRSGFQQDLDVVFPLRRLRELVEAGEVGSVAAWHYSFMGAADPLRMEESTRDMARLMKEDRVSAALLVPV